MTRNFFRAAVCGGVLVTLAACGETSGSVLELVPDSAPDDERPPPGSNVRIDVFVVQVIESCAVGEPCGQSDPDTRHGECIEIEEGPDRTVGFRAETVSFLPRGDPYVEVADHVSCFRLVIDDEEFASIDRDFRDVREGLYDDLWDLSGNEIVAEIHVHPIPRIEGGFVPYQDESGIFLPAHALDMAPSLASRETDFTFAITGARDPDTGAEPRNEHCAGTVQDIEGGLAGAGYTWLTSDCDRDQALVRAWIFQVGVALRDVNGFDDYYFNDEYPRCSEPTPAPTAWWPSPNDCDRDPDYDECGNNDCDDQRFAEHVLTEHWPRGSSFVGNHCNNDFPDRYLGESATDSGGVCDQLDGQQTSQRPIMR